MVILLHLEFSFLYTTSAFKLQIRTKRKTKKKIDTEVINLDSDEDEEPVIKSSYPASTTPMSITAIAMISENTTSSTSPSVVTTPAPSLSPPASEVHTALVQSTETPSLLDTSIPTESLKPSITPNLREMPPLPSPISKTWSGIREARFTNSPKSDLRSSSPIITPSPFSKVIIRENNEADKVTPLVQKTVLSMSNLKLNEDGSNSQSSTEKSMPELFSPTTSCKSQERWENPFKPAILKIPPSEESKLTEDLDTSSLKITTSNWKITNQSMSPIIDKDELAIEKQGSDTDIHLTPIVSAELMPAIISENNTSVSANEHITSVALIEPSTKTVLPSQESLPVGGLSLNKEPTQNKFMPTYFEELSSLAFENLTVTSLPNIVTTDSQPTSITECELSLQKTIEEKSLPESGLNSNTTSIVELELNTSTATVLLPSETIRSQLTKEDLPTVSESFIVNTPTSPSVSLSENINFVNTPMVPTSQHFICESDTMSHVICEKPHTTIEPVFAENDFDNALLVSLLKSPEHSKLPLEQESDAGTVLSLTPCHHATGYDSGSIICEQDCKQDEPVKVKIPKTTSEPVYNVRMTTPPCDSRFDDNLPDLKDSQYIFDKQDHQRGTMYDGKCGLSNYLQADNQNERLDTENTKYNSIKIQRVETINDNTVLQSGEIEADDNIIDYCSPEQHDAADTSEVDIEDTIVQPPSTNSFSTDFEYYGSEKGSKYKTVTNCGENEEPQFDRNYAIFNETASSPIQSPKREIVDNQKLKSKKSKRTHKRKHKKIGETGYTNGLSKSDHDKLENALCRSYDKELNSVLSGPVGPITSNQYYSDGGFDIFGYANAPTSGVKPDKSILPDKSIPDKSSSPDKEIDSPVYSKIDCADFKRFFQDKSTKSGDINSGNGLVPGKMVTFNITDTRYISPTDTKPRNKKGERAIVLRNGIKCYINPNDDKLNVAPKLVIHKISDNDLLNKYKAVNHNTLRTCIRKKIERNDIGATIKSARKGMADNVCFCALCSGVDGSTVSSERKDKNTPVPVYSDPNPDFSNSGPSSINSDEHHLIDKSLAILDDILRFDNSNCGHKLSEDQVLETEYPIAVKESASLSGGVAMVESSNSSVIKDHKNLLPGVEQPFINPYKEEVFEHLKNNFDGYTGQNYILDSMVGYSQNQNVSTGDTPVRINNGPYTYNAKPQAANNIKYNVSSAVIPETDQYSFADETKELQQFVDKPLVNDNLYSVNVHADVALFDNFNYYGWPANKNTFYVDQETGAPSRGVAMTESISSGVIDEGVTNLFPREWQLTQCQEADLRHFNHIFTSPDTSTAMNYFPTHIDACVNGNVYSKDASTGNIHMCSNNAPYMYNAEPEVTNIKYENSSAASRLETFSKPQLPEAGRHGRVKKSTVSNKKQNAVNSQFPNNDLNTSPYSKNIIPSKYNAFCQPAPVHWNSSSEHLGTYIDAGLNLQEHKIAYKRNSDGTFVAPSSQQYTCGQPTLDEIDIEKPYARADEKDDKTIPPKKRRRSKQPDEVKSSPCKEPLSYPIDELLSYPPHEPLSYPVNEPLSDPPKKPLSNPHKEQGYPPERMLSIADVVGLHNIADVRPHNIAGVARPHDIADVVGSHNIANVVRPHNIANVVGSHNDGHYKPVKTAGERKAMPPSVCNSDNNTETSPAKPGQSNINTHIYNKPVHNIYVNTMVPVPIPFYWKQYNYSNMPAPMCLPESRYPVKTESKTKNKRTSHSKKYHK